MLPTALFCCNDMVSITAVKIINSLNIKVPDDISIIGFDDIDLIGSLYPELTTVRVEREQMGIVALSRLVYLMENGPSTPQKIALGVRIVERQSVKESI